MTTINLTNPNRGQVSLLTTYNQTLPRHRSFLGFNKTNTYTLKVRIVDLTYDGIVVNDPASLVKIKINDQEGSDLVVKLEGRELYFDTLLDTKEILDCSEMESEDNVDKPYMIKYKVEYTILSKKKQSTLMVVDMNDKHKDAVFEHAIRFIRIPQEVIISPELKPLEYSLANEGDVPCGRLDLSLLHTCQRAPYLNMEFTMYVLQTTPRGEQSRYDIACIDADRGILPEKGEVACEGDMNLEFEGVKNSKLKYTPKGKGVYRIEQFYVNEKEPHHVFLPIKWNFAAEGIENPTKAYDTYYLAIEGKMWSREDESNIIELGLKKFPVTILRNSKQTDLQVNITVPSAAAEPETFVLKARKDGSPDVFRATDEILVNDGTSRDFNLVVKNTAEVYTVDGASIRIRDFEIEGPLYDDGVTVSLDKEITSPFKIEKEGLFAHPGDLTSLRFGESNHMLIRYQGNSIVGFNKNGETIYDAQAQFKFTFKYVIDPEGTKASPSEGDYMRFNGILVFPLTVAPKPEWMCIDFGTSAVVAEYGKSLYNDIGAVANNLIDLHKKKKALLQAAIPRETPEKRKDRSESGTEFISSMVAFNTLTGQMDDFDKLLESSEGELDKYSPSQFLGLPIWFSPSTGMIEPDSQLPCLKSLMGYESLPKGIFKTEFEEAIADHSASKVDCIYEVVYRQLFKYYVTEDVEKIVLSIPNTFAPLHLEKLRKIAIDCIPNLRHSRIRFVSESDAVAYYYLSRRYAIMSTSKEPRKDWPQLDENTLVYDMGAGTLDLTYFHKDEKTQQTVIDIKGKMGVNKAGNYIDYLIAEILADLLRTANNTKQAERIDQLLELNRDARNASVQNSTCNNLKAYVKDQVKPLLNNPEAHLPKMVGVDDDIDMAQFASKDILDHPKFIQFINEITAGVFTDFANLFGTKGKLPVNLVIFSGRSTSLQAIRDGIMDNIAKINTCGTCRFVDIASEKFVVKNEPIDQEVIKRLKSVVAAGALAYPTIIVKDEHAQNQTYVVKNKNVYATYGIMAHSSHGWIWKPLIDVHTRPVSERPKSTHGMDIYHYHSSRYCVEGENIETTLQLGNIDCLYVIQTYSSNPLEDWKNNKKEMITVLFYKGNLGNYTTEERVALEINEENKIVLWIGGAHFDMLSHDDFYNISFRKSMWPVIFSETQNQA